MISVSIGAPDPAASGAFDALARRAGGNVFLHPAALAAATSTGFAQVHALSAWNRDRLVGFWALRERRVALWPAVLAAPPYSYGFMANPMIDPDHRDTVMPAMFAAIADHAGLPNVLQLKLLDADAPSFAAIMAALGARSANVLTLSERERPFLTSAAERKRTGSTAKKLRQDWNRLDARGAVELTNARDPENVCAAFEIFLELELRSWKGASGTALLCHADDAAFARALVAGLSRHAAASVALLRLDGHAIAAQVLMYCGATAYTWKTAFDAEFGKFSPGTLLLDRVSEALFAEGITQIDSCSTENSFMLRLWTGRRRTVDLLIDVGAQRSVNFAVVAQGERTQAWLRHKRDRLRTSGWLSRRKSVAATTS